MIEHRTTCITKSKPDGGHEIITHIGGTSGGGWRISAQTAAHAIDAQSAIFYTIGNPAGALYTIGVVRDGSKFPYLRTHEGGVWNDYLLSLPSCPLP